MSVAVPVGPPSPPSPSEAPQTESTWARMEARLVSARVQDLLDDAMVRLSRLIEQEELSAEVATAVRETLVAVTSGRDSIASARRTL